MHQRAHGCPSLVSGQLIRNQLESSERDGLLAPHVPVLGDRLEQGARRSGVDSPAPSEDKQLLFGEALQPGDEAAGPRLQHVRPRERDHRRKRGIVHRQLERG